jgi:hypothetical protein
MKKAKKERPVFLSFFPDCIPGRKKEDTYSYTYKKGERNNCFLEKRLKPGRTNPPNENQTRNSIFSFISLQI